MRTSPLHRVVHGAHAYIMKISAQPDETTIYRIHTQPERRHNKNSCEPPFHRVNGARCSDDKGRPCRSCRGLLVRHSRLLRVECAWAEISAAPKWQATVSSSGWRPGGPSFKFLQVGSILAACMARAGPGCQCCRDMARAGPKSRISIPPDPGSSSLPAGPGKPGGEEHWQPQEPGSLRLGVRVPGGGV